MKRDPDLVRAILLKLEAYELRPGAYAYFEPNDPDIAIDGYDPDAIDYHAQLLIDAGFIKEASSRPMGGFSFKGLTWAGHDFVDSVRDPEVWARTKKGADAVKSWSIETLKDIAKGLLRKQIEEYTGVKL